MLCSEVIRTMPNIIKRMRQARNMSQGELAKRLGVCSSYLCEIETGRKFASLKMLCKLSQVFGCEVQELLDEQIDRKQKRIQADGILDSAEAKTVEEIREERAKTSETMLVDIMNGLQTLEFASRRKVLIYVNDLRRASGV